jgi:hypothetical protein
VQMRVSFIDQLDQFLVLFVDLLDAQRKIIFPFDQDHHRCLGVAHDPRRSLPARGGTLHAMWPVLLMV